MKDEVFIGKDHGSRESKTERIVRLYNESIMQCATAIENSKNSWSYIEGDPYSDKEKEDAKKLGKGLIKLPVLQNKISVLAGQEEQTRKEAQIKTDDETQFDTADVLNRHYSFLRSREDMSETQIKALVDGLIGQIGGWVEAKLVMNDKQYLDWEWENVDSFSVHPDPSFKRMDLLDCRWIVRLKYMSIDDMKTEYQAHFSVKDWGEVEANLTATENKAEYGGLEQVGDLFPVLEFQERVRKNYVIMDHEGKTFLIEPKDRKKAEKAKMKYVRSLRKETIRKTITSPLHEQVLFDKDSTFDTRYFSLFCCFSYDYNTEKMKIPSLIGILTDVQDQINKEKSQNTELVKKTLDNIWHVPRTETEAVERLERYHGQPKLVLAYKSMDNMAKRDEPGGGAIASIQAIASNVMNNLQLINEVSGVREQLSGEGGRSAESGVLYDMKKQSAQTMVNPFFANLAKMRRNLCRYYLELAPEVYAEHFRVLEIEDDFDNIQNAMLNIPYEGQILNDIQKLSARATIDDGEKSSDYQSDMFEQILTLMHMMTQAGAGFEQLPWQYLLDYLPMKNRKQIKEYIMRQMMILKEQKIAASVDARLGASGA